MTENNIVTDANLEIAWNEMRQIDGMVTDMFHKQQDYHDRYRSMLAAAVLQRGLLTTREWTYQSCRSLYGGDVKLWLPLVELMKPDYHDTLYMGGRAVLVFNDNDLYLSFREDDALFPFVRKHGLVLDLEPLEARKAALYDEWSALSQLVEDIKKELGHAE